MKILKKKIIEILKKKSSYCVLNNHDYEELAEQILQIIREKLLKKIERIDEIIDLIGKDL